MYIKYNMSSMACHPSSFFFFLRSSISSASFFLFSPNFSAVFEFWPTVEPRYKDPRYKPIIN